MTIPKDDMRPASGEAGRPALVAEADLSAAPQVDEGTSTGGSGRNSRRPAKPLPACGEGMSRHLKNRHIQMIALGGAIGTGLFYGSATGIRLTGPSIILAYLIGGCIIFMVMRALGEMSVHTPVSGAFSFYAYKNWSPFAGFFSGWNYWFNYILVSMAELAVVGTYVNFWLPGVPTWVTAAIFLVSITLVNLVDVKAYGEIEFWLAIVKVVAVVAMIVFGIVLIALGSELGGTPASISHLWDQGGFMPNGIGGLALAFVVVMFSFGGVELIGITAGEADNPKKTIPMAINQVVYRILIFYVGSMFVILSIYPWTKVNGEMSPFVAIFDGIGISGAAHVLNVVVLTAAISAYNSGLYANGRMLYSLAHQGNAPRFLGRLNRAGSPMWGVLVSSGVTAIAVVLAFIVPDRVFAILISVALAAGIINWVMVIITQMRFRRRIGPEEVRRLAFRMPLYPVANIVVLVLLVSLFIGMAFMPDYRIAAIVGPAWIALLTCAYCIKRALTRTPRHEGAS